MIKILTALIPLYSGGHALQLAHDTYQDGEPVPAWVRETCCGKSDFHHLHPDQVHVSGAKLTVDGYPDPIPVARVVPSPDGEWYVFWKQYGDGSFGPIYCIFGNVGSS